MTISMLRVFQYAAYVILYIKVIIKSSGTDFEEQWLPIFKRYIEKAYCYIKSLYNPERLVIILQNARGSGRCILLH